MRDIRSLFEEMWPLIRDRLRGEAPALPSVLAEQAITLDQAAVSALVDWLQESAFPAQAEEVRKLRLDDGDLLVFYVPTGTSASAFREIQNCLEILFRELKHPPVFILLPSGMTIQHFHLQRAYDERKAGGTRRGDGHGDIPGRGEV